jgi:hypothetical protein
MPDLQKWIEDNANLTLWCVHSLGPDEVDAAPSHAAAVYRAQRINEQVHSLIMRSHPDENNILCFCYAAPWPWSKAEHADSLKHWEENK